MAKKNSKQNRNQARKPSQKRKLPKTQPKTHGVHLSACSTAYARSLVNPFSGPTACVPVNPPVQTRKVRIFTRGSFVTSTLASNPANPGYASIVADPGQSMANDATCVITTTGLYDNNTIATTTGTKASGWTSNSDYTIAGIGTGSRQAAGRIVSAGLRIKYGGTNLNQGGFIYALQEPTHDNLDGNTNADLQGQDECRKFRIGNKWTNVIYRPLSADEYQFKSVPGGGTRPALGAVGNTVFDAAWGSGRFYMGMGIVSATPGTTFDFEFYTNVEFTGKTVRGATPVHVDPVGMSGILTTMSNSQHRFPNETDADRTSHEKSFLSEVGDFILDGATWVGTLMGNLSRGFEKAAPLMAMV